MFPLATWLFLFICTVDALLPVVSYRSSLPQLAEDIEDELLANNLYGEQNGYVIPVRHYAKGIFRLDLSFWNDGSVFDEYSRSIQEELQRDLNETEDISGEFNAIRRALKEALDLQKELLRPNFCKKFGLKAIKEVALFVLRHFLRSVGLDGNGADNSEKWRKETRNYLDEQLLRTKIHLTLSQVREELRDNFKRILEDLLLENKLNEQLFNEAEQSLYGAVEDLLGHDYEDSIFAKLQRKAARTIRAFVINIDHRRKYLDVQIMVPVALMRDMRPMIHVVDLGSYSADRAFFEMDILPVDYFYRDSRYQWKAVGGPCTSISNLFICDNVLPLTGNCQLNFTTRSSCRRDRLSTEHTSTFVRRMTQAYVVATNQTEGILHNDEGVETSVTFTGPTFFTRIFGSQELIIGDYHLKGLSDIGRFTLRFGPGQAEPVQSESQSPIPETEGSQTPAPETEPSPPIGGYLQSTKEELEMRSESLPAIWIIMSLAGVVAFLFLALIYSHISLSRKIRSRYNLDSRSTTLTLIKDLPYE